VSASDVIQEANRAAAPPAIGGPETHTVSVETVGQGTPPPGESAPRSDAAAPLTNENPAPQTTAAPDANELKPNVPSDASELKPNVPDDSAQALPPPQQVNEIQQGGASQPSAASGQGSGTAPATASSSADEPASDADMSSSKKKKKKGIHKIVPF